MSPEHIIARMILMWVHICAGTCMHMCVEARGCPQDNSLFLGCVQFYFLWGIQGPLLAVNFLAWRTSEPQGSACFHLPRAENPRSWVPTWRRLKSNSLRLPLDLHMHAAAYTLPRTCGSETLSIDASLSLGGSSPLVCSRDPLILWQPWPSVVL